MEKSVRIETNKEFGRHIVANEDIEAGQLVVDELPFALGPKQCSPLLCLGCYSPLDESDPNSKCVKCGWPLCCDCVDSVDHSRECEIFSQAKVLFQGQNEDGFCPQLDCILPLSEVLGRYLTAGKDIFADEMIIEEMPFASGPKLSSPAICLGCYTPVSSEKDGPRCPECRWPLCAECDRPKEHQAECRVFKEAKVRFQNVPEEHALYFGCAQLDCITPLRVLLIKEADPERWESEVAPMEYHDKSRRENKEIWNADLVNVAKYLRGPCKLDRFSEDLIMQVIGILEVNAFEARTSQGHAIRCLYPITGILAHSCVPNTTRSIYPTENYRIKLRAMVDVKKGDQLSHSYTYTLSGTAARQEHLKSGKYFTCRCKRCSDPTELGTHFSSFKCSKCDPGLIITTDPFDLAAEWKCSNCDFKTSGNAIQKAVAVMQAEIDEVQAMDMTPDRLEHTERLFRKYRSILHPLHFIQTGLRQSLIEMYGRVAGYEMSELPDVLLERKEELCRDVLKVLNVFEPGISRSRAMMLYELHVPIVLTAKTGFQLGILTGESLKKKLQEAVDVLAECANILQFEDPTTPEGNLAFVAAQSMEQLKASIEQVGV